MEEGAMLLHYSLPILSPDAARVREIIPKKSSDFKVYTQI
jgi:hypothetical protein